SGPWPMRELRVDGRCCTTSSAGRLASPRMRRTSGYARLAPIACGILLGAGGARVQSERWPLTRFAEHDVSVEIALERSRSGTTWIVGTYTPSRATLHLYGKDLPKSGIHGVARPTLLELVSSASIRPAGPLVADQPTIELQVAALGLTFPVYPEGAVTLRLPGPSVLAGGAGRQPDRAAPPHRRADRGAIPRQAQRGPVRPRGHLRDPGDAEPRRVRGRGARRLGTRARRAGAQGLSVRRVRARRGVGPRRPRAILGRLGRRGRPLGHRATHVGRRLLQLRHRGVHRRAARLRDAAGHGGSISDVPDVHRLRLHRVPTEPLRFLRAVRSV